MLNIVCKEILCVVSYFFIRTIHLNPKALIYVSQSMKRVKSGGFGTRIWEDKCTLYVITWKSKVYLKKYNVMKDSLEKSFNYMLDK